MISTLKAIIGSRFRLERDPNTPRLDWTLLHQFWELTIPFWRRPGAWKSWLVLGIYTAYTVGISFFSALTAKFAGDRLNALARHNGASFYKIVFLMLGTQFGYSLISILFRIPYSLMEVRWQQWLTKRFLSEYLQFFSYYFLNRDGAIDNPDERIAVDAQDFVYFPLSICLGLISAFSNLGVFGYILWSFGWYLVPASAVTYIFYSLALLVFNRPIMTLSYAQKRLAGDFRFGLVKVRTNSEPIAFLRGDEAEKRELGRRYDLVIDNSVRSIWWSTAISVFSTFTYDLMELLPNLLIGPLVLSGKISLSGYTQALNAWNRLGSAFGYFGREAESFASYGAVIGRLYVLRRHCVGGEREDFRPSEQGIRFFEADHLAVDRLTIRIPNSEQALVRDLSLRLDLPGSLAIAGLNGVGKTSLLRALARLWKHGTGDVKIPSQDKVLFLPQQPYMSLGSLREQMIYPRTGSNISDEELRRYLDMVNLGHLEARAGGMEGVLDWTHTLSPGEQQRLTFTRVLAHKPEIVVLDEATSALDPTAEEMVYRHLLDLGCSFISVVQRAGLISHHDTLLELLGGGAWRISKIEPGVPAGGTRNVTPLPSPTGFAAN